MSDRYSLRITERTLEDLARCRAAFNGTVDLNDPDQAGAWVAIMRSFDALLDAARAGVRAEAARCGEALPTLHNPDQPTVCASIARFCLTNSASAASRCGGTADLALLLADAFEAVADETARQGLLSPQLEAVYRFVAELRRRAPDFA